MVGVGVGSKQLRVSTQKVEKSISRFSTSVASKEGGRREGFWERSKRFSSLSCVGASRTFT